MKKFFKNWGLPILYWFVTFLVFVLLALYVANVPNLTLDIVTDNELEFASFGFVLCLLVVFTILSISFTVSVLIDVIKERRQKRNAAQDKEASHD